MSSYTDEQFNILLDTLAEGLLNAKQHYRIFKKLHESLDEYNREIYQHIGFWGWTFDAHLNMAILCLCRSYDKHRDALSLNKFLEIIKSQPNRFSEDINQDELEKDIKLISNDNPLIKKILSMRDKKIAHTDIKLSIEREKEPNLLSFEEIQILIDRGFEIYNKYRLLYNNSRISEEFSGQDDYKYILSNIKIGRTTSQFVLPLITELRERGKLEPNNTINSIIKLIDYIIKCQKKASEL